MATQLRQMQETAFPLVGGFGQDLRSQVSPENTYNMYVSIPSDPKQQPTLLPMPGLRPLQTFKFGGTGRKQFTYKNQQYMYSVVGQNVYRSDSSLNRIPIGELGSTAGIVGIAANNASEITFVDGAGGWVYDETTGVFTDISTVENFPIGCNSIGYLDGYLIAFYPNSPQFGLSDINDAMTWPIENIGQLNRKADYGVAVGVVKGLVLLMGYASTESWFDAGGALFPFARDNNALYEYGCAAVGSVAEGFDKLFWLARDANGVMGVMYSEGGMPQKVSTYEEDIKLANIANPSDAVGDVFKINGHIFYQLSFTEGNITFVFDFTSNSWALAGDSKFDTDTQTNGNRHLMQSHAYFNNTHYAVSYNNATLYQLDQNYYKYDQENILRLRKTFRFMHPTLKLMRVSQIDLLVIRGVGLQNGTDANPFVEMQVSFDGGQNWTKPRQAILGRIGVTQDRTIFYECGIAQSFVFMFKCWNAVDFVLMGGAMKYDVVSP